MKIQEPNLQVEQVFLRMPCSLWWMDRDHKYLGCNIETCAALRAHSPDEILGKTMIEIAEAKELSEFKAKSIYDTDERIMQTGVAEFQIKNMVPPPIEVLPAIGISPASGESSSTVRQLGAKQPILNKEGEVIGLMGVAIFDREMGKEVRGDLEGLCGGKDGNGATHRSAVGGIEQFRVRSHPVVNLGFKEAFDLMPCSLWWMDRKHLYLGYNLECYRLVEINSEQEMTGKTIYDIGKIKNWPESKSKNIYDLDEFIMQTGIPEFDIENIVSHGHQPTIHQWAAKKAIFNKNGEVIGLMGAGMYNGEFGISQI